MNPQPGSLVVSLIVIGFVCLIIFRSYFSNFPKPKNKALNQNSWDMIPIGVVYDTPSKKVTKKTSDFEKDCISVLVSLGTKKSEAKKVTMQVMENHNPQSLEEFIRIALQK